MKASCAAYERLDLTGVHCPHNSSRAIMALEVMEEGDLLEIVIDDGEPLENVPVTLKQEGHELMEMRRTGDQWTLLVRRGEEA